MLWFLLFGLVGYLIYKLYKRRWFRSLQTKIAEFKGIPYRTLSTPDKYKLRGLVDAVLKSDMTLDEETNKIVGDAYQEIEREDFYRQGGVGLQEFGKDK